MSSIISKLINFAGNITGILPVVNGGTGVATSTGTTNVVLSNGPTLVAPLLGTPASGNLSNCTNYPNVTQSVAGLVVSAGQLLGISSNVAATAGNVGEVIQSVYTTSGVTPSNGQWGNATTISLTAGQWFVTGAVYNTRVSSQTVMLLAVSAFSNNTTTDHVNGYNVSRGDWGAWNTSSLFVGPWLVNINSTTTIYLKVQQDAGTFNTANWPGNLTAFRMR